MKTIFKIIINPDQVSIANCLLEKSKFNLNNKKINKT